MVSRFVRYGLASVVAMTMFANASSESALGHFPFRRHCFARSYCPPAPVWRTGWCGPQFAHSRGIWGGGFHRNFYSLQVGCWPSYSFSAFPIHNCAPVFCQPVFFQPVIYTPVFHTPVFHTPICDSNAFQVMGYTAASSRRSSSTLNGNRNIAGIRPDLHRTSVQPVVQSRARPKPMWVGLETRATKPKAVDEVRTLQPYSPVWADSAVGLMDDMVARGDWEIAYKACVRMDKIPSAKNHRVLLRQAILEMVAHRDAFTTAELDRIMDRFSQAADAGCNFSNEELRGGTLARYLEGSGIELGTILDDLSRRVLEQPTASGRELLLVSVLLTLDGQGERAALFTKETRSVAALSDSFRWQSVLRSLDGQLERDSLVAARNRGR